METIHESRQKGAGTPSGLPEAALFSVVKPNQRTTEVVLSAAMDGLAGRSSSLKTPLGKKTSFRVRDWAKRSNSNRTAATTEMSPSEALKSHIKHLGGGRLDNVQTQGTANNTTLLAPPPTRTLRRRASSIESRATQWLDFYTGSPDPNKSNSEPLPKPSTSTETPRQRQRAGSNSSLRPAPLRVPSSERQNKPIPTAVSSPPPPPPPPTNPLERKNSKWKPLPNLPAQPGRTGTANEPITPPHKHPEDGPNLNIHSDPAYPAFLPVFRFDSPPPTPDSTTGIAAFARTHAERERDEQQKAHTKREEQKAQSKRDEQKAATGAPGAGQRTPPLTARAPLLGDRPHLQQQQQQQKSQQPSHAPKSASASAHAPAPEPEREPKREEHNQQQHQHQHQHQRQSQNPKMGVPQQSQPQQSQQQPHQPQSGHTRQERVWLHVNYRGEAPFLRAWGLDIGRVEDRVEGVGILRELMRADGEDEYIKSGVGGGISGDRGGGGRGQRGVGGLI